MQSIEKMCTKSKQKMLIYAHYYSPDVASTGQIVGELAENMLAMFDITIICTVPSYTGTIDDRYKTKKFYEEVINGVKVFRIRVPEFNKTNKNSRVKNVISYFFGAMRATLRLGKMNIVFAISQPPILGGLLGVWGKWINHATYIYNIQDFNPEQVMATGYTRSKLLIDTMMRLDKFSCKQADLIITVGRDLVETVKERFKNEKVPETIMINNWIDENEIYPLEENDKKLIAFKKKYELYGKFVIMYSGNIGIYYDLENLIKVINRFKPGTKTPDGREVAFVFVGGGALLECLKNYAKEQRMSNTFFIPYQKDIIYSLNAGDVHWCVNGRGIKGVSCPSKYYGIAAVAKPIIGVLEKGSEIRCIIENIHGGLCCEPGEYKMIEKNIGWFIKNAKNEELKAMGSRNRKNLEKKLSKNESIRKYIDGILQIQKRKEI